MIFQVVSLLCTHYCLGVVYAMMSGDDVMRSLLVSVWNVEKNVSCVLPFGLSCAFSVLRCLRRSTKTKPKIRLQRIRWRKGGIGVRHRALLVRMQQAMMHKNQLHLWGDYWLANWQTEWCQPVIWDDDDLRCDSGRMRSAAWRRWIDSSFFISVSSFLVSPHYCVIVSWF